MTVAQRSIDLGYRPRPWQAVIHRDPARFRVLAIHRRAGKTELAIMALLDAALRSRAELPVYAYICPYLSQAKTVAWARLKHRVDGLVRVGAAEVREGDLAVRFAANGAVVRLFGGDRPDALRGIRLDGVVVDEVGHTEPALWTDILQPALSDRRGWGLFLGTPNGIDLLSELWHKRDSGWSSHRLTVHETDAIDPAEVARLQRDMPANAFAREYLCDFAASAEDQVISLTDVEAASRREYVERDIVGMPVVLGVDPARFGDDRTVIVRRCGLAAFPPVVLRGLGNMEVASIVAGHIVEHRPDAVFIDSGAGAGVIDRLRQLGHDVIEVPFGGTALKANLFANRRCEMWWGMREWVQAGGSIPDDRALKAEMATPTYWFDSSGRRVLESKDEIKKRLAGGASPDMADALALTFAAPVHKRTPIEDMQAQLRTQRRRQDYDPLA